MENSDVDIDTDPLFVGLTRPATKWGVPLSAFIINVFLTTIVFLAFGNIFLLLIALPVHLILYLVSYNDPYVFDGFFMWFKTSAKCMNKGFWGAVSYSPLRYKKWKDL